MKIRLLILTLFMIISCKQGTKSPVSGTQYTLTPITGSENLYLSTKDYAGVIFAPTDSPLADDNNEFMPSIEDIEKAERIFKICLSTGETDEDGVTVHANVIQDPSKYFRQYVGYKNKKGERIILLNCFIKQSVQKDDTWKRDIIAFKDGGNNYFSVHINLTKERCFSFSVNGLA